MALNMKKAAESYIVKGIIIAVLTILMLIPVSMITSLIEERADNKVNVKEEISYKWGGEQSIVGPVLVIPYETKELVKAQILMAGEVGEKVTLDKKIEYAYFLPNTYNVDGEIKTEERARSIYNTLVYQSATKFSGSFAKPNTDELNIAPDNVKWEDAFIIIGVPYMQGIKNKVELTLNGKVMETQPGVAKNTLVNSGLTIKTPLTKDNLEEKYDFEFEMNLNGCEKLFIAPIGKENNIKLRSDWKTVGFIGDFLASNREITSSGFDAEWNIFDYNRNYVQMWKGENTNRIPEIGVELRYPVDQYQMSMRSVKYAIMFIVLTFVIFFFVEIITKKRIHPIQYALVSFALIIFYTLLIALSEHINFNIAYLVSAIAIVTLITLYTKTIFEKPVHIFAMGAFVAAIYVYLYVILQLEDMSLLIGALGLFIALAAIMYASRKVDWYKEKDEDEDEDKIGTKPTIIREDADNRER